MRLLANRLWPGTKKRCNENNWYFQNSFPSIYCVNAVLLLLFEVRHVSLLIDNDIFIALASSYRSTHSLVSRYIMINPGDVIQVCRQAVYHIKCQGTKCHMYT